MRQTNSTLSPSIAIIPSIADIWKEKVLKVVGLNSTGVTCIYMQQTISELSTRGISLSPPTDPRIGNIVQITGALDIIR